MNNLDRVLLWIAAYILRAIPHCRQKSVVLHELAREYLAVHSNDKYSEIAICNAQGILIGFLSTLGRRLKPLINADDIRTDGAYTNLGNPKQAAAHLSQRPKI